MRVRTLWLLAAVGVGIASGCGPVIDDISTPTSGKVCYVDSDCVPDDCCGQGHSAVHIDDAPNCRGVTCGNNCPANSIDCVNDVACGIPVCRDQRCTVARTVSEECPG